MKAETAEKIIRYHEATKHHYHRYARSSGYLDWRNQPDPFRFYQGCDRVRLPFIDHDPKGAFSDLLERAISPARPFTRENIAACLELSLGLSAWKEAGGSRWALRMNPSSGNLHPTEAHLVLPATEGYGPALYHYTPFWHALERRADLPDEMWQALCDHFNGTGCLVGLTSIFWRESWKYGERAYRYCNHDVGHALAGLSLAAGLMGWRLTALESLGDGQVSTVLGLNRVPWRRLEEEHPDLLCWLHDPAGGDVPRDLPDALVDDFSNLEFIGAPNSLSQHPLNWEIIYEAAAAAAKPRTSSRLYTFPREHRPQQAPTPLSACRVIRQRRSALAFDGRGGVAKNVFLDILGTTLPRQGLPPFDLDLTAHAVHLLIFAHQVESLPRGMYMLVRNPAHLESLKEKSRPDLNWQRLDTRLPLYLLEKGDFRGQAISVSCGQEIAGLSAFSLGMITLFKPIVKKHPYRYRHLFWETGMIGQMLYLAAESHGVRGTGIGCYFDDAVHDLLGLTDNTFQSLYHFTIGHPVEDRRLATHPPYYHLKNERNASAEPT